MEFPGQPGQAVLPGEVDWEDQKVRQKGIAEGPTGPDYQRTPERQVDLE
ncbi:MAG: hypothetical protein AAF636_22310 [Pseudomonadota bacterium]